MYELRATVRRTSRRHDLSEVRMHYSKCIIAAFLMCVTAYSVAHAQPVSVTQITNDGTIDRSVSGPGSAVEFIAEQGSGSVSLRLGRTFSRGSENSFSTWSAVVSAPASKSADKTDLANLNGLANAISFGLKYVKVVATGRRKPPDEDAVDPLCEKIRKAYHARTGNRDEPKCDTENGQKYLAEDDYAAFKSLFWDPDKSTIFFGGEGRVGSEEFAYLDDEHYAPQDVTKNPSSLKFFIAVRPGGTQSVLTTVGGEFQNTYRSAGITTVCPISSSGNGDFVECKRGALGSPIEDGAAVLFWETRMRLSSSVAGASLRLAYDFKQERLGVDLPVFLFRDRENKLRGGIRLGWRSDTGEMSVGIFVGRAFALFS